MTPLKFTRNLLIALLSFTTTGFLFSADTSTSTTLDKSDQAFVANAALSGQSEVQVSELALQKGENSEVKAIATMIVKDHQAVNTQITDLAKAKGLVLTTAGNPDADKIVTSLEKDKTGADFDRAYLNQVKKSHKASIEAFSDAARDSTDADVKTWAEVTVVALRAHLERINAAIAVL